MDELETINPPPPLSAHPIIAGYLSQNRHLISKFLHEYLSRFGWTKTSADCCYISIIDEISADYSYILIIFSLLILLDQTQIFLLIEFDILSVY